MSLHDYLPILAFMTRNRENKEIIRDLTGYIYRKQKENFSLSTELSIDYNKEGAKIYKKLEESIQKEADKRR